jgi:hypothetical protein
MTIMDHWVSVIIEGEEGLVGITVRNCYLGNVQKC